MTDTAHRMPATANWVTGSVGDVSTNQVGHPAEPDPRMDETGVLCSA